MFHPRNPIHKHDYPMSEIVLTNAQILDLWHGLRPTEQGRPAITAPRSMLVAVKLTHIRKAVFAEVEAIRMAFDDVAKAHAVLDGETPKVKTQTIDGKDGAEPTEEPLSFIATQTAAYEMADQAAFDAAVAEFYAAEITIDAPTFTAKDLGELHVSQLPGRDFDMSALLDPFIEPL